MTISAAAVWEIRSTATASNVNGGFFVTGASGTDFSQQNAAQYALTGVTTSGSGAVFLTASAANDMVGNGCRVVSGTNFTAGWYEVISVSVGVSVTVDRNCCTGAGSSGVINIGGALSMASTLDDDLFDQFVAGQVIWWKAGTYVLGEAVGQASAGTAILPIKIFGYNSTRGDNPLPGSGNQPVINASANSFTLGQYTDIAYCSVIAGGANGLSLSTSARALYCSSVNNSTTAGRSGILAAASGVVLIGCEAVSIRGNAVRAGSAIRVDLIGCYLHDSNMNISSAGGFVFAQNCIIARPVTAAIEVSTTSDGPNVMSGNTIYGTQAKVAIGMNLASGATMNFINNIVYGFNTGVDHAGTQTSGFDDYNCYYNNTANVSSAAEWQIGANSITATDPAFTSATEVTGATATTSNSGNTLIQSGATFVSAGVTAVRDYVHIISTSGTVGKYTIVSVDSQTQLTLGQAPGASTGNVSFSIGVGSNFAVGSGLAAEGYPGLFPGGLTTGYTDIGAAQRQASSGSSSFTFGS